MQQGIFSPEQGIFLTEQGKSTSDQGSPLKNGGAYRVKRLSTMSRAALVDGPSAIEALGIIGLTAESLARFPGDDSSAALTHARMAAALRGGRAKASKTDRPLPRPGESVPTPPAIYARSPVPAPPSEHAHPSGDATPCGQSARGLRACESTCPNPFSSSVGRNQLCSIVL